MIPKEVFTFLSELKEPNARDWFQATEDRYEERVKAPLLDFIAAFDDPLCKLSPLFLADLRPSGGLLFRIYRDVRFSKDKSPYKTEAGTHFRHEMGKTVRAPGYYLHLATDGCFAACGLWHPETTQQTKIRTAMDADQTGWNRARTAAEKSGDRLGGETLQRPPKGFSADRPLIEDLKRKDYTASVDLTMAAVTANHSPAELRARFKVVTPFRHFLTGALGLAF